jgi:hypothetical protein
MRVSNPDRSSPEINGSDVAQTSTRFLEIVGDGFPVLSMAAFY